MRTSIEQFEAGVSGSEGLGFVALELIGFKGLGV